MRLMMRMLPCLVAIIGFGLPAAPALAGFYSGSELFDICTTERSNSAYFEKSYECVGYIAGAVDAFNRTREVNKLKSCLPPDVTISQLKDVTVDYLRANPNDRKSSSAGTLVFSAMRKAWPCKKQK